MQKISSRDIRSFTARNAKLTISFAIIASLTLGWTVVPMVQAQQSESQRISDQIRELENQNEATRGAVGQLQLQASSYQDAINKLAAQISGISAAIATNQAKQTDLQQRIDADQIKLEKQKAMLGENLKVMYVNGQMTTVEMLATSKDLSSFVDAETYRGAVQKQIQETLKRITDLQNQLRAQKNEVEKLLAEQKVQQDQLASNKAQQDQLLALNQGQQDAYNSKISETNGQIGQLKREQAAIIARMFAGDGSRLIPGNNGNDTYPNQWRNAPIDSIVDSWGMYNRQCVSYTAWKVAASGRRMPYWGGIGNANQWDDNARAAGIPVDGSPRPGDVAVKNSGYYGHVMYVEHVYADGSIYVSQYNADWQGTYSEAILSASSVRNQGLVFIHF